MKESNCKIITLALTEACNLNCAYCYEHHRSDKTMSMQTAKAIIDREFDNLDGYDSIEFDLFGGEPFLEFDLMRNIAEYICKKKSTFPSVVFTSTNGTLVHGEAQQWLREHDGCFICGLSLDGTREMHNINRSGSYDDIDLDFFLEQYPYQPVKMTVSKETLPHLADGVIEMHERGFHVSCNLGYEIDWSSPENAIHLTRELNRLIDYYLENPKIEPCSMLDMGIFNIGGDNDAAVRYCGAGNEMRTYDVAGNAYPCQFFMPLSLGEAKAAEARKIKFPRLYLPEEKLDAKCKGCVLRSACPNCYGANYINTGSIYSRDDNMCRLTKIVMKARSYFRARQWELGQLEMEPDEIQALLRAIMRIQEELEI